MKKALPLVVAVLVLALATTLAVQMKRNSELQSDLRSVRKQLADSEEMARQHAQELAQLRTAQESFTAEAKALRERLATSPPAGETPVEEVTGEGAPAAKPKATGMQAQMAKMFKDPEMKKVMRTQQGMGIRMMYGDLASELGLSPNEAEQLTELLTDRQLAMSEQGMEMMSGNADEKKMAELAEATQKKQQEYDKELADTLGADRYSKFKDYERTMADRVMLRQYQDQFAARGTPLADEQKKQLLAIMGEERIKVPASPFDPSARDPAAQMKAMRSEEMMTQQFENQKQINNRVLQRAATVLSPEQVNSLRTSQEQMLEMQQMGMKMSREMFKQSE